MPATAKSQRRLSYNRLTGTLHLTDGRGREVGYYLDRLGHDFGPGAVAARLTKIIPSRDDDANSYSVLVAPDFDACDCKGHARHGHCKHAAALRCLRARGSI